ncbi:hypothetical protein FHS23_003556 [Prauserella isguenensis]|uniref:Uncharacterized protein n=1 Tax=Prauserella isguenensis TaxID=1470180 RepID=A0A839S553_9PSEU|nr:hypothetical protein [Prauserella isguenensis]MBB3052522.1 hypothetical protein [Prauserella isguenensis]
MVGRFEAGKDTVQVLTEQAASHVGNIAGIITGAVRDVARETGDWMTELIEMREASGKAVADDERDTARSADDTAEH